MKSKKILYFSVLSVIIIFFYKLLFKGFFQQDEWYSYGYFVLHKNLDFVNLTKFIFAPNVTHYNPLTVLVEYILFNVWGMNYLNFIILGIISHILVVFSVYLLALRMFSKDKFKSFLTALLFGIFASIYQGVSWPIVGIAVLWSALVGVFSAIFFLDFIKKKKAKYFIYSMILLLVSLFIKEITLGLFPFYLLMYIIYSKHKPKIKTKYTVIVISLGLLYVIFRVFMVFTSFGSGGTLVTQTQSTKYIIYNLLTLPLRSLTQIIIPPDLIHLISQNIASLLPSKLTGTPGTPDFNNFVLKKAMETFSLLLSFVILIMTILILTKRNSKKITLIMCFSLAWVFLNSLIISLSPGRSGVMFVVDSRNLYFLSVGVSIFLIEILSVFSAKNRLKFFSLFAVLFISNIYFLNKNLTNLIQDATTRKNILAKISNEHPTFPKKVIIYTESDTSYYGLPENIHIMPFQSGFGQTLLSWYERKNNFPSDFFSHDFLWPIDSQGYMSINDTGFGYYRNFEDLAKFYSENKNKSTLIAYSFDSKTNSFFEISQEIYGRLNGYEVKKRSLDSGNFTINSSANNIGIRNAIDGDRKTFWDSRLPYANYQNITIDMRKSFDIAEVVIDSYNDPNQNSVGYRILLSKDSKNWKKVFESKIYPALSDGKDKLFFEPTNTRFVRIEQIGYHKYASWVINELNIYEKD